MNIRTGKSYVIDKGAMRIEVAEVLSCKSAQLLQRINADFMFILASPNRKGSTPITIARKSPVNIVIEPITVATGLDCFRVPICLFVFADQLIFNGGSSDVPRWLCVINQSRVTTPAMWVLVFVRLMLVQRTRCFQLFYKWFIGLFKEHSTNYRNFGKESSIGRDGVNNRQTV